MADSKSSVLGKLEETLELYLVKKAPALPENIKEVLVNFAPWINIIVLVIAIPGILAVLAIGTAVLPFLAVSAPTYGVAYTANYTISVVILAVAVVLQALAIPGLFKKSKAGWNFAFYANIVSLVSSVVGVSGIVSGLIGALIGFYILFQIKSYYK